MAARATSQISIFVRDLERHTLLGSLRRFRFSNSDNSISLSKGVRKINTQKASEAICEPAKGAKVLLHSCCAPCSGAMVEHMTETMGLDVTIFFYNPNIHPRKEYEIRKDENKRFADQLGIPFVDADYDAEEWFCRAKGMEWSPERGLRCTMCFDMRFERSAQYAQENGFEFLTTTNATSRWKDADQVNSSGRRAAAQYEAVQWFDYDWQTEEMTRRKYEINAKMEFYKQEYCGCSYSLRDSNAFRRSQGQPSIQVPSSAVYSDARVDEAEESLEVVQSFFEHEATREVKGRSEPVVHMEREALESVYGGRRRDKGDGQVGNNW